MFMPRYSVKWADVDSPKKLKTWDISDVPLDNKKEAKDRFLFELKDTYGLTKKDVKIYNIASKPKSFFKKKKFFK